MRGKVKYVTRNELLIDNPKYQSRSDVHAVRQTCTIAVLYDETVVEINEDDIRDFYNRSRITNQLIGELSNDLHNVWIKYYEDEDGDYYLDGELSDYI